MSLEDEFLAEFGNVGGLTNAAQLKARQWYRCVDITSLVSTTSTTWTTVLTLNLGSPPAGEFQVLWSLDCTNTTTNKGLDYRIRHNGTSVSEVTIRPTAGGVWCPGFGCASIDVTGDTQLLTLDYKAMTASGGVGSAQIKRACICAWRVG